MERYRLFGASDKFTSRRGAYEPSEHDESWKKRGEQARARFKSFRVHIKNVLLIFDPERPIACSSESAKIESKYKKPVIAMNFRFSRHSRESIK